MSALRCIVGLVLALAIPPCALAQTPHTANRQELIARTESALFDQMKCEETPKAAVAINAMLKNKLIRYVDNESGAYLFEPTVPLTFLGLPIRHISGFDDAMFQNVPDSLMVGTAPPLFLELDIAAPESELRKRALDAGLDVGELGHGASDLIVWPKGLATYLAKPSRVATSTITCSPKP